MSTATQKIVAGSTEYVGVVVTCSDSSVTLTDDTVELAIVDAGIASPVNPTWRTPSRLQFPTPSTAHAWLLVGPQGGITMPVGTYRLWARVVDLPEVPWVASAEKFRVI